MSRSTGSTVALVLSGGANLGAVHVGMVHALMDTGVVPDLIVGTSVGALNGAYIASRWDVRGTDGLDAVWTGINRGDVFPTRLFGGFLGFIGKRDHLVPPEGLRGIVERHVEFELLQDAPIALHVIATDLLSGLDRRFSTGSAVDAIMASAAIPALFPPVEIDGRPYIDGGVVNNTPISHAVELGATEVWILPAGTACGLDAAPTSTLAIALHAVSVLINRRLQRDVERFQDHCNLHILPPLCPVTTAPTDFGQARQLIDRAYATASTWLASSHDGENLAAVLQHPHRPG